MKYIFIRCSIRLFSAHKSFSSLLLHSALSYISVLLWRTLTSVTSLASVSLYFLFVKFKKALHLSAKLDIYNVLILSSHNFWENDFYFKMDTYIRAAFDELLDTDGLAVMAKGMGIQRLLIKFLQYYSMAQLSTGKNQTMYGCSLYDSRHLL